VSALFPGQLIPGPPEASDGRDIDLRLHAHAATRFIAGGGVDPPAGQRATAAQVEQIVRKGLDALGPNYVALGEVVLERGLPAPYLLLGHRQAEERVVDRERKEEVVTWFTTEALAILRDARGDIRQLRLSVKSRVGHLEDEELRARFLRSLRFE
jgi:hypothetical protein